MEELNHKGLEDETGGVTVEERFGLTKITKLAWAYAQRNAGESILSPWK